MDILFTSARYKNNLIIMGNMCCNCNLNSNVVSVSTLWWSITVAVGVTILISWVLFHHLIFKKKLYPKFCQRFENAIEWVGYWLQRLWYAFLFIGSTVYVILNYEQCCDLTFTSSFNGFNVIFVFWLILLILPLFERFEGFGVNIKLRHQNKKSVQAANNAMGQLMNVDELETLHKNGGTNE